MDPDGALTDTWHLEGDGAVETVAELLQAAAPTAAVVRNTSSVFNFSSVDGYWNQQL